MRVLFCALLAGLLGPSALAVSVVAVSPSTDSDYLILQHGRKEMPPGPARIPDPSPTTVVGDSPNAEIRDPFTREQRVHYNTEQYARAVADSRRLSQLASELEADLERAGDNTLPSTAFRKADEIAKLAKSVKDRLKPR